MDFLIDILLFFQNIRCTTLNIIFSVFSVFGEELFFLALMAVIFWCVNKRLAYKIMFSFTVSTTVTMMLKVILHIQRPWLIDGRIEPVESAKLTATGYSFPSSHVQHAINYAGCIFLNTRHIALKATTLAIMIMVPISRMYLGVHTLLDVGVAFILSFLIVILVNKVIDSYEFDKRQFLKIALGFMVFPALLLCVTLGLYYNEIIDYQGACDAIKCAGCLIGMLLGWYFERSRVNFNERCDKIWRHALKCIIGFAGV